MKIRARFPRENRFMEPESRRHPQGHRRQRFPCGRAGEAPDLDPVHGVGAIALRLLD